MVKFPAREGISQRKAEIRFYKTYKSAMKFWEALPEAQRISFSSFGKTELNYGGKYYSVIVKYYIE